MVMSTTPAETALGKNPDVNLFLVETYGISSFLGDYGLGQPSAPSRSCRGKKPRLASRPGARRRARWPRLRASSIRTVQAANRFTNRAARNHRQGRRNKESWHVEAEVGVSWGFGGAKVSGGAAGEYQNSRESFAKQVEDACKSTRARLPRPGTSPSPRAPRSPRKAAGKPNRAHHPQPQSAAGAQLRVPESQPGAHHQDTFPRGNRWFYRSFYELVARGPAFRPARPARGGFVAGQDRLGSASQILGVAGTVVDVAGQTGGNARAGGSSTGRDVQGGPAPKGRTSGCAARRPRKTGASSPLQRDPLGNRAVNNP